MRKSNFRFNSIVNGNMATDIIGPASNVEFLDNVGMSVVWTGTPTGLFTVEVNNTLQQDSQGVVTNAGTWIALSFNPALTVPSGAPGSFFVDVNQTGAFWIRFHYTATSGAGTLNVTTSGKMI